MVLIHKGLGISIKQTIGFDHVYDTPDLQNEYGPGTLAGYVDYGEQKDGEYLRFDTGQFYTNSDGIPTLIGHAGGGLSYGPKFDGRPIIDYDGSTIPYSANKNNMQDAYETGYNTNTALALKGGNEKGNFYLSDSYSKRTGTLPNNSFDRNSMLFRGSYKLAPWLRASASVSYTTSTSKNPKNDLSQSFFSGTFERIYNTEKYKQRQYYQAPHGGVPSNNFGDEFTNVPNRNLWFDYAFKNSEQKEQVIRPIVTLTADVTDWLSITAEGNMNQYNRKYEQKDYGRGFANEGGYYELKHTSDISKTGKLVFNFNKNITEDITANLILGGEIWAQEKSETRVRTDGGLIVPGRFYLKNSKRNLLSEGKIFGTKQLNSLYFLSSFGYKDQVFLDITGRNDWSSSLVYTNGTGNYSYFYPSVSGSWVFSESLTLPSWFTFGKLRASWAQVGSDTSPYEINKGYSLNKYEVEGGSFVYRNGVNTTLVDQNIKPERKNSYEIGTDVRFFNNRLGIDFAYYDETITEQIGQVNLDSSTGYKGMLTNIGTLTNSGYELAITGTPIRTEDFEWNTTFNHWKNTTKISDLHEFYGERKGLGGSATYGNFRVGSFAFEGGEYGVLMSDSAPKRWQSDDPNDPRNGMKVLKWSDGRKGASYIRSGEIEEVGKIQPDFEGSWNNEFNYKGLSLSILLDARYGGHIASYSNKYGTSYGYLEGSLRGRDPEHGGESWTSEYPEALGQSFSDGIIPEGVFDENTTVQAPNGNSVDVSGMTYQEAYDAGHVEPTHASYFNYFKNSWGGGVVNDDWFNEVKYIAIRNISLGYNLPKTVSDKMGAKNLYIGINARNLGYLYNSLPNNLNPESFRGTSSSDSYYERSFSPYTANYTMTISVDF